MRPLVRLGLLIGAICFTGCISNYERCSSFGYPDGSRDMAMCLEHMYATDMAMLQYQARAMQYQAIHNK